MTRTQKINKIVEAALNLNFSDRIDDIEMLSYIGEDGRVYEDRFDNIDTTAAVSFIGGTGYPNFSVPITKLTDESLDTLCGCVLRKNAKK